MVPNQGVGWGRRRGGIQADGYCCHCFLLHSAPSLCWLQSPLQSSLLVLDSNDLKLNRLAVDCCISKHTRWHRTSRQTRVGSSSLSPHLPSPPLPFPLLTLQLLCGSWVTTCPKARQRRSRSSLSSRRLTTARPFETRSTVN